MASSSLRAHTLMKLLCPRVSAPFSVRSLSSATPRMAGSDSNSNAGSGILTNGSDSVSGSSSDRNKSNVDFHSKQCPNGEACSLVNRFLKEGPSIPHKVMKHERAVYVRLDMPGIGKESLKMWVEGNSLHVNGEEEVEKEYWREYYQRKYYGNIQIPQGCYDVEEITAEIKNGVLRIKIPKSEHIIDVKVKCPCPCPDKTDDDPSIADLSIAGWNAQELRNQHLTRRETARLRSTVHVGHQHFIDTLGQVSETSWQCPYF